MVVSGDVGREGVLWDINMRVPIQKISCPGRRGRGKEDWRKGRKEEGKKGKKEGGKGRYFLF